MADDAGFATPTEGRGLVPLCPWCSAALPAADADACPSCQARLVEAGGVEILGLTTVDPALLAAAAAPRRVKRSLGALLVGNASEIPPPSEAGMLALARPDADVRREILRLEMDAKLASLKAEVASRNAEDAATMANGAPPDPPPAPPGPPPPETGPGTGESPGRD